MNTRRAVTGLVRNLRLGDRAARDGYVEVLSRAPSTPTAFAVASCLLHGEREGRGRRQRIGGHRGGFASLISEPRSLVCLRLAARQGGGAGSRMTAIVARTASRLHRLGRRREGGDARSEAATARKVSPPGGIQWMLQVRAGTGWRSRSFCQTREALIRCCGGEQHPALLALPARIGTALPAIATMLALAAVQADGLHRLVA
jgi:hypothetical protein